MVAKEPLVNDLFDCSGNNGFNSNEHFIVSEHFMFFYYFLLKWVFFLILRFLTVSLTFCVIP